MSKAFISAFAALLAFLVMASIASMALSAHQHSEADTILMESQIVEQRFKDAPWFLLKAAEDHEMDASCPGAEPTELEYLSAAAQLMSSEGVQVEISGTPNYVKTGVAPNQQAQLTVTLHISSRHVDKTASVTVSESYQHTAPEFVFGGQSITPC
ncbi:MAG: hypothetical protein V1834_03450 [Candidatus Micrarchaeota archaeon]